MSLLGLYDFDFWPWADDDQPGGPSEQELNVSDIETRDENRALGAAYADFAYGPNGAASRDGIPAAAAFQAGWKAGREYARQQAQDRAQQLVTGGMRLLGCTHTASCASVGQCAQRPLGT